MYCVRVMSGLALRPNDYEVRICYVSVLRTAKRVSFETTVNPWGWEELGAVPASDRHLEFKMPRTPRLRVRLVPLDSAEHPNHNPPVGNVVAPVCASVRPRNLASSSDEPPCC
jgi:hypothetical protein